MRTAVLVFVLAASSTSFAQPMPNSPYRAGANHHIGDDSYREVRGHLPGPRDPEPDRMHVHLAYMHDYLAAHPATRPELEQRRAEILGYLADYVAKGTTPKNEHLPWRTPVFIDDHGTICAVGYLIERTTGRALPERIAAAHRYDYLEEIAAAMPEVRAWVASSGFTLDELASIQPAYEAPQTDAWRSWDLVKFHAPDGTYDNHGWHGTFARGQMEGAWSVSDDRDRVVGRGTLHHGAGAWTSYYADGKVLAEGHFHASLAAGAWKLYFESGSVAAEGRFTDGMRAGMWSFYRDAPEHPLIARGEFDANGDVDGTWHHYDDDGKLAAITRTETPDQWRAVDADWSVDGGEGTLLEVMTAPGEVQHRVHEGSVGGMAQRLDMFALGAERIYVQKAFEHETIFDRDGYALVHGAAGWQASDCHWASLRKEIANAGDVVRLHGLLYQEARRRAHASGHDMDGGGNPDAGPTCGAPHAIVGPRAAVLDVLIASRDRVTSISPAVVREAVLASDNQPADDGGGTAPAQPLDYASVLADNMAMYIEWPHVDGRFVSLFETMPGRFNLPWYDRGEASQAP
ncbi:MAG TPA: hypothetical protein VGF94_26480 [Kofleriaceae bacterium]|jgi:hypothetical protein